MNQNKTIFIIIIITGLIIGGGIWLAQGMKKPEIKISAQAKAQVIEKDHDWGTIPLKGGDVTKTFTIKNTGTEPLQLHDIQTSCMCTTAEVNINGKSSPKFGMHQKSAWVGEVAPGEETQVKIIYDPDYHGPSGVGDITRQVKVATNDPNNPELKFNLSANVVN